MVETGEGEEGEMVREKRWCQQSRAGTHAKHPLISLMLSHRAPLLPDQRPESLGGSSQ